MAVDNNAFLANVGVYSYGTALLAYSMLSVLIFLTRRRNPLGGPLLIASTLTALWAGAITASSVALEPLVTTITLTEIARNAGWVFVLLRLLENLLHNSDHFFATRRWLPWFIGALVVNSVALVGGNVFLQSLSSSYDVSSYVTFSAWLTMSIAAMLLLEQLFRNNSEDELWATKHLFIGLGILFAYDFFMYAEALLNRNLDQNLWQARGIVTAMCALLMGISISRTDRNVDEEQPRSVHMSRHVAFHSLTLMASGIYLITMALAAYFIRFLGGNWGGVLQIAFLCASGLGLLVLLFSGRIRAKARVWLSKNFFSYKYDYRLEWLQFTQTLASGNNDIPQNITRAVAQLAKSPAALLWSAGENNRFQLASEWQIPPPAEDIDLTQIAYWLSETEWLIDLQEWRQAPDIYQNLEVPQGLRDFNRAWLIIPLLFGEKLQGILLLCESDLVRDLNWEDRDLLKVAGRQAASHLAQYQADQALVESRQFEAFNRLSAYVIHDLKNILAQLSLMVSNAQKHKHNPEFIDDMVDTVSNSVDRMSNLMMQLRSGERNTEERSFRLDEMLGEIIEQCKLRDPAPTFITEARDESLTLNCDKDRLQTVFGHLIQNAQDATQKDGEVRVSVGSSPESIIVEIQDTGAGMDDEFIRSRLFKPFDSTKGLTGMGIGAFESREFIRSLGGDIQVTSTPGVGSLFKVYIPSTNHVSNFTEVQYKVSQS